ncbi:unnamed protein product [Brugia timori]|uniref:Uncharacterized protein n=1 Tax=Brugia timori TaxID=42155 RepID=A0A3P7TE79_9BILA|nr:unnamed protein product [Brugia timori]
MAHCWSSPLANKINMIMAVRSIAAAIKNDILQPSSIPCVATRCSRIKPPAPAKALIPFEKPMRMGAYLGAISK